MKNEIKLMWKKQQNMKCLYEYIISFLSVLDYYG